MNTWIYCARKIGQYRPQPTHSHLLDAEDATGGMLQIIRRHISRWVHEFAEIDAIYYEIVAIYVILVRYWGAGDWMYEATFVQ